MVVAVAFVVVVVATKRPRHLGVSFRRVGWGEWQGCWVGGDGLHVGALCVGTLDLCCSVCLAVWIIMPAILSTPLQKSTRGLIHQIASVFVRSALTICKLQICLICLASAWGSPKGDKVATPPLRPPPKPHDTLVLIFCTLLSCPSPPWFIGSNRHRRPRRNSTTSTTSTAAAAAATKRPRHLGV